jgi:2-polyprenyl-3-methyl-5-hydroxy-6-metoxy-1,4-benzoquinol methylase
MVSSSQHIEICVENSAPSQKRSTKSLTILANRLSQEKIKCIADYGFGRLRNLDSLLSLTEDVTLVDVSAQIERMINAIPERLRRKTYTPDKFFQLKRRYDLITCIAVLHIVPEPRLRKKILRQLRAKLKPNGKLIVEIPRQESYYADESKFEKFNDGILLGKGIKKTFRKKFLSAEVNALILSAFPPKQVEVISGTGSHLRLCYAK